MATNVHYLPQGANKQAQLPTQQIVDRLCSQSLEQFKLLIDDTFGAIDDTLFKRAEKAANNSEQSTYLDDMRLVRMERTVIERAFLNDISHRFNKLLEQPYYSPPAEPIGPPPTVHDGLSLVEDSQLEETLALSSMVARARTRFSLPLSQLETRLAFLIGLTKIDYQANPVDPEIIANAFDKAARDLELSVENKLIIYKLFDKHLMSDVGELCEKLNRLLIDANVLAEFGQTPWFHHRNQRAESTDNAPPANNPSQDSPLTSSVNPDMDSADLFQLMQQLLNASAPLKGMQHTTPSVLEESLQESKPVWSAEKLVNALSAIQNNAKKEEGVTLEKISHLEKDSLKQQLVGVFQQSSPEEKPANIGRSEDNVIDIIGMLFDFILDDQGIPDTIKALIGRLQIPMLKVGILDKTFFSKKQHPARILLNDLARAGTGWNEDDPLTQQELYTQMQHIVNRILNEFNDDISIFVELQKEFSTFLSTEQTKVNIIEERTRQAEEGKSRVAEARAQIQKEIETRAQENRLPEAMTALLHQVWSKIPLLAYLREGPTSHDWQQTIATLDKLVWTLVPKRTEEERKKLLTTIPGLLQELRQGFNQVQCNPMDTLRFFKTLESCHINCIRASSNHGSQDLKKQAAAVEKSEQLIPGAHQSKPTASAENQSKPHSSQRTLPPSPEKDQYLQKLESAPLGSWFLFTNAEGQKHRAKLSIRIAGGGNYVFVNRAGIKVSEHSPSALVEGMSQGRVKILADDLILDRALESVLESLRQMHDNLL
ncbi:protein of unknown function DUF1631 [Nitrosococcus halophilus Nc 4]|uniref:Thymidine phosphorylase n=1 Tax=Nitrosococcus halophilus (strain Nc4) TaxID=472759 RepID=D5BXT3_NITHN|nr:DUF1631 domain-containing protein [Nitrosococcus halophilus]ADE15844.1 protein of unknown function DUF1631 [Nitrosococcus halophilus Nc 4]